MYNNRQSQQFVITEMSEAALDAANEMRLQSWLDIYVNDDLGITRDWLEEQTAEQASSSTAEKRRELLADPNSRGWVALDRKGVVIGSTNPYIDETGTQHVGPLYVSKEWHGAGVGPALMQRVMDWFDTEKPIMLEVASYNARAIRWGFVTQPGSEKMHRERIPVVTMIREVRA